MDDLNALARRNRALIEAHHQPSRRQHLRDGLLRAVAHLPVPQAPGDGRTILLVRPDHVGDVLLTGPAIQALKAARPDARLVALVGPWSAGVISAFPEIDLTLTLPFPGFARNPARTSAQPYWLAWQRAQQLRRLQAETAILFRPDHWWGGLLIWLAGIPQRIGYDLPNVAPFLTEAIPFRRQHVVLQDMALLRPWTDSAPEAVKLSYPVDPDERSAMAARLADLGLSPGAPSLIIHPGSGTAIKQWAPEHWAAVADHLAAERGVPVIFTGGDHELRLIETISGRMAAPTISLAGDTNLSQLAALYENAALVLGPDSGPLHLAAAVGAPTVTLFGPADPAEFGPWGDPDRHVILTTPIACRPCRIIDWPDDDPAYHPCVRDISVEAVIAAAQRVTQASPPPGVTA